MIELCQRGCASCGACCGLYNRRDLRVAPIALELRRRTEELKGAPRTLDGFREAASRLARSIPEPLFASVRVCPLLGFLDESQTRIGCLAHPRATPGVDLRDAGVYDASVCESFLCPSFSWLNSEEATLVESVCADYYLYGLVVTDVPFLRAVLSTLGERVGESIQVKQTRDKPFRVALRELFGLKRELAPGSEGLFGAFRATEDGGEAPRSIEYGALHRDRSRHDAILVCAGADPRSGNDLDVLEAEVDRRVERCVRAYPDAPSPQ